MPNFLVVARHLFPAISQPIDAEWSVVKQQGDHVPIFVARWTTAG
jgi:hypothetical protein